MSAGAERARAAASAAVRARAAPAASAASPRTTHHHHPDPTYNNTILTPNITIYCIITISFTYVNYPQLRRGCKLLTSERPGRYDWLGKYLHVDTRHRADDRVSPRRKHTRVVSHSRRLTVI